MCSRRNVAMVRALSADHVVEDGEVDVTRGTAGVSSLRAGHLRASTVDVGGEGRAPPE